MKIIRVILFLIGCGLIAYSAFAADQIKTTETYIADSEVSLSSADGTKAYPFTLYIGDNISSVTNPIKSLHFTVSGVYTGSGTIILDINGVPASSKTFTLPDVSGTPTPFEIDYKDNSSQINPTSAGSYNYTLNSQITGSVVVYGLGIKMTESHRYESLSCADGVPANQKIKTTEVYIADSDVSVSGVQSYSVPLYIGDNISGITNPIKSLHFTTSGVYTGSGTITFRIDNDVATEKIFTLPNAAAPTPFEIDYRDNTGKISPTSAGSYTYTLNFIPSGVTMYGLGIKMTESHRYAPPSCGLVPFADLTSAIFDSGLTDGVGYNSIMWKGTTEGTGKVKFQLATSNSTTGPWTYYGGSTCGSGDWYDTGISPTGGRDKPIELSCATALHNNHRYYRYKIRICSATNCTDSGATSPVVSDVVVSLAP